MLRLRLALPLPKALMVFEAPLAPRVLTDCEDREGQQVQQATPARKAPRGRRDQWGWLERADPRAQQVPLGTRVKRANRESEGQWVTPALLASLAR
mmetsp:Transcript_33688/g.69579  ORF Transcript_33688/g.69579 Transcript_33688/m.69579 type:complete len:96 (-) Transcript_33688:72-359(-)